ncbi:MAG: heme-binding domain-containing protein [Trueperaceae bacterium]|nr:MAG: heme-binding domain-containing protein [Trueperaceae bacterium]
MKRSANKAVWWVLGIALALLVLIQLVPSPGIKTNPPITAEPTWDSPQTHLLAERACFDCHSNETAWPWYTNVAPVSWLIARDVLGGREALNFSTWGNGETEGGEESAETLFDGTMPLRSYLITHPDARLSASEKQQLAQGLLASLGGKEGYSSSEVSRQNDEDD